MHLPSNLHHSIQELLKNSNYKELISSSARITDLYREGASLSKESDLLTYLTVRLPATYAAIFTVLREIPFRIGSLLDLGAGPGTGWWAAREIWGAIEATLVEREPAFAELGKKLGCPHYFLGEIEKIPSYKPHDLALFGYSLGELAEKNLEPVWQAVDCVAIIEPGTPRGFQNILAARDRLIELGGHVLAPCPHSKACPHPKWCHFSVRVERSSLHRQAKQASLSYEDEKFSYVIVTKEPLNRSAPRILSTPQKRSGHVNLQLCAEEGIEIKTVSKKEKERFKKARKARWGDLFC
ncbi:MAG: rRNA methyltransferase [Chlamydiales bacterium]|nr:rRNA methyltransferase [Chlamydiales bacterium]